MTEYTLGQMKENRRLWVEALRSGKYKQGQGYLRSADDHYCCLGVLCDVAGIPWRHPDAARCYVTDGSYSTTAPISARSFVGLWDSAGRFGMGDALASRNDDGATFSEIADLIESNPPGLFIDSMEDAR